MGKALFDNAASDYDDHFTHSVIGQMQRKRVYYWLEKSNFFSKNKSVFELNCGTGYDADYFNSKGMTVRATDISPKMIEVCTTCRSEAINFETLDFKDIEQVQINEDVVFSNFGGLNCLTRVELEDLILAIGKKQVTGNSLVFVIMPKFSLVESVYLFFKLKWSQVFRRSSSSGVGVNVNGINVPTYFHSPKTLRQLLRANYQIKLVKPVALFLPPSYLEPFAKRRPKFMKITENFERIFGRFSVFSGISDHFIIIAEKK